MKVGYRNGYFEVEKGKIIYTCPSTRTQVTCYYYGKAVIAFNGYGLITHTEFLTDIVNRMITCIITGNTSVLEEGSDASLLW